MGAGMRGRSGKNQELRMGERPASAVNANCGMQVVWISILESRLRRLSPPMGYNQRDPISAVSVRLERLA